MAHCLLFGQYIEIKKVQAQAKWMPRNQEQHQEVVEGRLTFFSRNFVSFLLHVNSTYLGRIYNMYNYVVLVR